MMVVLVIVVVLWVSLGASVFMSALNRVASAKHHATPEKRRWLLLIILCGPIAWLLCVCGVVGMLSDMVGRWVVGGR